MPPRFEFEVIHIFGCCLLLNSSVCGHGGITRTVRALHCYSGCKTFKLCINLGNRRAVTLCLQAVGLALCCAHAALQYLSLYCHDTSSSSIGWGVWPLNAAEALNNASHKALSVLGAVATVTGFRGAFILIDLTFMTGEREVLSSQ